MIYPVNVSHHCLVVNFRHMLCAIWSILQNFVHVIVDVHRIFGQFPSPANLLEIRQMDGARGSLPFPHSSPIPRGRESLYIVLYSFTMCYCTSGVWTLFKIQELRTIRARPCVGASVILYHISSHCRWSMVIVACQRLAMLLTQAVKNTFLKCTPSIVAEWCNLSQRIKREMLPTTPIPSEHQRTVYKKTQHKRKIHPFFIFLGASEKVDKCEALGSS